MTCAGLLVALGGAEAAARKKVEGPFEAPTLRAEGPRPPWRRRRRVGVRMRVKHQGLIELKQWPAEPTSPQPVDPRRLGRALRELCADWMPPRRPFRYARWILESTSEFGTDPFLLAALIYRQSRCLPQKRDNYGTGLAMINARMHGGHIKRRRYRYWVLQDGAWIERQLDLRRHAFVPGNLRRARPSIYFAAGLLRMYREQCPGIDGAFGSVPHRHHVSHFIWGDRVRGAGAEDRVLRARRRLIEYYWDRRPPPRASFKGLPIHCPVDGAPRKITSGMGADRSAGKRFHRGVDFASSWGEPVRAVADGRVTIAGLDRKRGGPKNIDPEQAGEIRRDEMGPGGLFVMIYHGEGLTSAYMHLARYVVRARDRVKAGQVIGVVGKSGIKESGAHLHFEFRLAGKHIDPLPILEPYVFGPLDTYLGRRVAAEQARLRRRRRIERWRARKAAIKARREAAGDP